MKITKNISLNRVYKLFESLIADNHLSLDDRVLLYRFLNKLTDTEEFELHVNREFSAHKLKTKKDNIEMLLSQREEINLPCEFVLQPYKSTNWQLYWNDELFLDSLDLKIARRIAFDINVAFSIKASQLSKLA